MTLSTIVSELHAVNALLKKYVKEKNITYEQGLVLSCFYVSYKDTNSIIRHIEKLSEQEADQLMDIAHLLHEATRTFLNEYEQNEEMLIPYNPKPVCDEHLRPFEVQTQKAKEESLQLWRRYTELSNRLDITSPEDPNFAELDKECDAAKEVYDAASKKTKQRYEMLQEERKKTASLYYFDMTCLEVLVSRLERITSSLIKDLENLKKGDAPC